MATSNPPPGVPDAHETDPLVSSSSNIAPTLPLYRSVYIGIRLWAFKAFVQSALSLVRFSNYISNTNQPTLVKYYPVRPHLEVRIFFPPGHSPDSTTKLPTYLNIHGGGFALCSPAVDDQFCTSLSRKNFLVISLSYSLSPSYPFPTPVDDIIALITATLADPTLPIDPTRVALGGFSAGGNLTLAAAQHPTIHPRLRALVPIYPVVDFSGKYKGEFQTSEDGRPDMLARTGELFSWGYIPPGTDRRDVRLSPIYAERSAFGGGMRFFFVGAEKDVLCKEARAMAGLLMGKGEEEVMKEEAGKDECEEKGVRWLCVKGQRHGFTHAKEPDAEREKRRVEVTEELWTNVAGWLEGVFAEER